MRHWDLMFNAGVRATAVSTRMAVPLMLPRKKVLIVNTSIYMKDKYHGHVFYDVAKTAVNRMALAMGKDLEKENIAVVALAPGWVRTERVLDAFGTDADHWQDCEHLPNTESPRFIGRAVSALADDSDVMKKSGLLFEVGALAREYGFTDVDGRLVAPFSEQYPDLF